MSDKIDNIKEIKINDTNYPEELKKIQNPPEKMYVLGDVDNLSKTGIAIIGSRSCSEKRKRNSKKIQF